MNMDFKLPENRLTIDGIKALLAQLKMPAMAESFFELATNPIHGDLTMVECVGIMAWHEVDNRANKRQQRYLQRSGLRELSVFNQADIDKVITNTQRGFKLVDLKRYLTCDWIRTASNVLINGATGTGKTWLLALLGKQACMSSYQTLYCRFPQMMEMLTDAREHRESARFRRNLNRNRLLIIDDFGMDRVTPELAADLLTLLEERESNSSVAIASQLPFEEWHQYLGGNRSADAIMDRLLNSSYQVNLGGQSLRELTLAERSS